MIECYGSYLELFYFSSVKPKQSSIFFPVSLENPLNDQICGKKKKCCKKYKKGDPCNKCPKF